MAMILKKLRRSLSGGVVATERADAAARRISRSPPGGSLAKTDDAGRRSYSNARGGGSDPSVVSPALDSSAHGTSSVGSGGSQRSPGGGGYHGGWSGSEGEGDILISTPLPPLIPIKSREKERRRSDPGPGGIERAVAGRDSPNSLRFKDAEGRDVVYSLRPSLKKSRSTVLEVAVGTDGARRKVRRIRYDGTAGAIRDGRDDFRLPHDNVETVMRKLAVLCKISRTKLDCVAGSPESSPESSTANF